MRITRLRAENFRALGKIDLELRPLTVVIGANGAGKSSLLELLELFRRLEKPAHFAQSFAPWGGYAACVFYGASEPRIRLGITASDDKQTLEYDIDLFGEQAGFFVQSERLIQRRSGQASSAPLLTRADATVTLYDPKTSPGVGHGSHTTLAKFRQRVSEIERLLEALKQISLWQVHRFQPSEQVRSPQQLQPTTVPSPDGSDLFSALYSLKTERRDSFRQLLQALQSAVPELEELEFPLAGAGHVNLTWKQKDFPRVFYSNQLSDGILRFLWIVTVLHTVPDNGLVMLDEPELSLHPQWVMLLASILRKASARTNILVATQSAELIRWLEPGELVIADIGEQGTTLTNAADMRDLKKWLEDFTLAELWASGELGGRR